MTNRNTLLVFAHRDEASAFADVEHLVSGIGKVNAATSLGRALADVDVDEVLVLGTAGVIGDGDSRLDLDTVYQVTTVLQHDFSLPSPELHPAGEALAGAPVATMATGDVFVQDDAERARIASLGAELVDMEGYAFASVCERFGVPLRIFKIPSDFADSTTTAEEWDTIVFRKSEQLRAFWDETLTR